MEQDMSAPWLVSLFDLQRFTENARLTQLIQETESRYGGEPLSEDDLGEIWAAGGDAMWYPQCKDS